MLIQVTREDLATHNPVASALSRHFTGLWHASQEQAWPQGGYKWDHGAKEYKWWQRGPYVQLPAAVQDAQSRHHAGEPVEPYEFEHDPGKVEAQPATDFFGGGPHG